MDGAAGLQPPVPKLGPVWIPAASTRKGASARRGFTRLSHYVEHEMRDSPGLAR